VYNGSNSGSASVINNIVVSKNGEQIQSRAVKIVENKDEELLITVEKEGSQISVEVKGTVACRIRVFIAQVYSIVSKDHLNFTPVDAPIKSYQTFRNKLEPGLYRVSVEKLDNIQMHKKEFITKHNIQVSYGDEKGKVFYYSCNNVSEIKWTSTPIVVHTDFDNDELAVTVGLYVFFYKKKKNWPLIANTPIVLATLFQNANSQLTFCAPLIAPLFQKWRVTKTGQ